MRLELENSEYQITVNRRELATAISALSWADELIPSDKAFVDYIGCERSEFRNYVARIAEWCRSTDLPPDANEIPK